MKFYQHIFLLVLLGIGLMGVGMTFNAYIHKSMDGGFFGVMLMIIGLGLFGILVFDEGQ